MTISKMKGKYGKRKGIAVLPVAWDRDIPAGWTPCPHGTQYEVLESLEGTKAVFAEGRKKLTAKQGDIMNALEQCDGYVYGFIGMFNGAVPLKSLKLLPRVSSSPLLLEIANVCDSWVNTVDDPFSMWERIGAVLDLRRSLINGNSVEKDILVILETDEGEKVPRNELGLRVNLCNTSVGDIIRCYQRVGSKVGIHSRIEERRVKMVGSPGTVNLFQLSFQLDSLSLGVSQQYDVRVNVYSKTENAFLFEDFVISVSRHSVKPDGDLIDPIVGIFTNMLPSERFNDELFLVFYIFRNGALEKKPNTSGSMRLKSLNPLRLTRRHSEDEISPVVDSGPKYRCPYGCVVYRLTEDCDVDVLDQAIVPDLEPMYTANSHWDFPRLHLLIIMNDLKLIHEVQPVAGLGFSCTYHGKSCRQVSEDFPRAIIVNRPQPPEKAISRRNDMYLWILGGSFIVDRSITSMYIRVGVIVGDKVVRNCISVGRTSTGRFDSAADSFVVEIGSTMTWNEMFVISLSDALFEQATLFLEFRSAHEGYSNPGSAFAYSKIPLFIENGVIGNGEHRLAMFGTREKLLASTSYLQPSTKKNAIHVQTHLSSTSNTQVESLNLLYSWRTISSESLTELLTTFEFIPPREVLKFSPHILDTLFEIIRHSRDPAAAQLAFFAVLTVIRLAISRGVRNAIDEYFSVVSFADVSVTILECCSYTIEYALNSVYQPEDTDSISHKDVANMIRGLEHITPSLVREMQKEGLYYSKFVTSFVDLYLQLVDFLSFEPDEVDPFRSVKRILFQKLSQILTPVLPYLPARELAMIGKVTLDKFVSLSSSVVLLDHFEAVSSFCKLPVLFDNNQFRSTMEPMISSIVCSGFSHGIYETECASSGILYHWIDLIHKHGIESIDRGSSDYPVQRMIFSQSSHDTVESSKALAWSLEDQEFHVQVRNLFPSLRALCVFLCELKDSPVYFNMSNTNTSSDFRGTAETTSISEAPSLYSVATLFAAVYLMSKDELCEFISKENIAAGLVSIVYDSLSNTRLKAFPTRWLVLHVLGYIVASRVVVAIASGDQVFHLGIKILLLDWYSNSDKSLVELFRVHSSRTISSLREILLSCSIEKQRQLLLGLLQSLDLPRMVVSSEAQIHKFATELYGEMLKAEFHEHGSFQVFESATFHAMHSLSLEEPRISRIFQERLSTSLSSQQQTSSADYGNLLGVYIRDLEKLYLSLKFLKEERNEIEKISHLQQFLEYLSGFTARSRICLEYAEDLISLQERLGNHLEAGLAIEQFILPLAQGPVKAATFERILADYDQANEWERMAHVYRQYAHYLETEAFDYNKISEILLLQAACYDQIVSSERFFPKFFKVKFHGYGFDEKHRDKTFIFRGRTLETLGAFSERIRSYWGSDVKLLGQQGKQSVINRSQPDLKILDVSIVDYCTDTRFEFMTKRTYWDYEAESSIPHYVRKYRNNTGIRYFTHSRALQSEAETNQFKGLRIIQTVYETRLSFPGIHRESEVINITEYELDPLVNAINSLQERTLNLEDLISVTRVNPQKHISQLSMVLTGLIDAAVNGGTRVYLDAFLSPEAENQALDIDDLDYKLVILRESLQTQNSVLKIGLALFGEHCGTLKGLFDHLTDMYQVQLKTYSEYQIVSQREISYTYAKSISRPSGSFSE